MTFLIALAIRRIMKLKWQMREDQARREASAAADEASYIAGASWGYWKGALDMAETDLDREQQDIIH